jgi:hypothetical protein
MTKLEVILNKIKEADGNRVVVLVELMTEYLREANLSGNNETKTNVDNV